MDRALIDKLRREIIEAFVAEDWSAYGIAVVELEKAIGKDPGTSNYPDSLSQQDRKNLARRANAVRWNKGSFEIDIEDGIVAYSMKFGQDDGEDG